MKNDKPRRRGDAEKKKRKGFPTSGRRRLPPKRAVLGHGLAIGGALSFLLLFFHEKASSVKADVAAVVLEEDTHPPCFHPHSE